MDRNEQFHYTTENLLRYLLDESKRQTEALEVMAARTAPPTPSAPPEQPKGEAERCPGCDGGCSLCLGLPWAPSTGQSESAPPAQAATEVTHEQARTVLKEMESTGYDDVWYQSCRSTLLRYIDQQSRRDAAEQVPQAAPRVEGGMANGRRCPKCNALHPDSLATLLEQVASEARADERTIIEVLIRGALDGRPILTEKPTTRGLLEEIQARAAALPVGAAEGKGK